MSDNYPVTANRDVPMKNVGIHIAEAHRAHGGNFPVWAFIQIFGGLDTDGGKWAQPEPDEVRCMTFIALQQRATAINYFSYWPKAPKTWSSIEKLNADLVALAPYLIADGEETAVKSDDDAIWARARKFKGGSLIFAVATIRAAVLSRRAAIALAVSSAVVLLFMVGLIGTNTQASVAAGLLLALVMGSFAASWIALGVMALRRGPIRAIAPA